MIDPEALFAPVQSHVSLGNYIHNSLDKGEGVNYIKSVNRGVTQMTKMTNQEMFAILERRNRLEDRIKELGGTIPNQPIYVDGESRNAQLLSVISKLESEQGLRR